MEIQPFRFDGSPVHWELALVDPQYTTPFKLLAKFLEEWEWGKKPLGWAYDPSTEEGRPYMDPKYKWIIAPYRKNFYISIEKAYDNIFGPHSVRLMYRSWQVKGEIVWVAICQIHGRWWNEENMQESMIAAIDAGELYQSIKTSKQIVLA